MTTEGLRPFSDEAPTLGDRHDVDSPPGPVEQDDDPTLPHRSCGGRPDCQCEAMHMAGDRLLGAAQLLRLYELTPHPRGILFRLPPGTTRRQ